MAKKVKILHSVKLLWSSAILNLLLFRNESWNDDKSAISRLWSHFREIGSPTEQHKTAAEFKLTASARKQPTIIAPEFDSVLKKESEKSSSGTHH